jgi:hypothetical protein
MATANRPSHGPTCYVIAAAEACVLQCSRSVTARSGSGPRCAARRPSLPPLLATRLRQRRDAITALTDHNTGTL